MKKILAGLLVLATLALLTGCSFGAKLGSIIDSAKSSDESSAKNDSSKNSSSFTVSDNSGNSMTVTGDWPSDPIMNGVPKVTKGNISGSLTINGSVMVTVESLASADANAYLETIKAKYNQNTGVFTYDGGYTYGGDDGTTKVGLLYGDGSLVITVSKVGAE